MIIRNDASYLCLLGWKTEDRRQKWSLRPMTGVRSTSNASVYLTLSRFLPFTVAIADIHKRYYDYTQWYQSPLILCLLGWKTEVHLETSTELGFKLPNVGANKTW